MLSSVYTCQSCDLKAPRPTPSFTFKFEPASFSCRLDLLDFQLDHCYSTDLYLLITLYHATEVSEPGPCTRLGYISGPLHPGPLHTAMIIMTLTRTRVKACKFELASFSCKLDSQVLKLDHCSSTDLCLLITLFCIDQN